MINYHPCWIKAETNENRIENLHADDTLPNTERDYVNQNAARLEDRRVELETFLSIIANLCDTSDYEDILNNSTSFNWILKHIEQVYDLEKKGVHFLKLNTLSYDPTSEETKIKSKYLVGVFSGVAISLESAPPK